MSGNVPATSSGEQHLPQAAQCYSAPLTCDHATLEKRSLWVPRNALTSHVLVGVLLPRLQHHTALDKLLQQHGPVLQNGGVMLQGCSVVGFSRPVSHDHRDSAFVDASNQA